MLFTLFLLMVVIGLYRIAAKLVFLDEVKKREGIEISGSDLEEALWDPKRDPAMNDLLSKHGPGLAPSNKIFMTLFTLFFAFAVFLVIGRWSMGLG